MDHLKATGSSAAEIVTPASENAAPKTLGNYQVLAELIKFFRDELKRDAMGTCDWIAQGDWEVDAFIAAITKLETELALRD